MDEIEKSLYVDDLISGSHSTKKALELKQTAKDVFSEAGFELHKWHSNVKEIEAAEKHNRDGGESILRETTTRSERR